MSNYIVEDEMVNYRRPTTSKTKKKKSSTFNNKSFIGIAIILIIIITIIFVSQKKFDDNSYASLEMKLVKKAKEYINNGHDVNKEIYLDVSKLDMSLPNDCNILSGVLYRIGDYVPNLVCRDYRSKVVDNSDEIKLIGEEVIMLLKGQEYYELGYNSSHQVQISSKVNTSEEGVYNVYYISSDSHEFSVRKVIVVNNINARSNFPAIDIGKENIEIEYGNSYTDNVTAIDGYDGDITNKIIKLNSLNTYETGEYRNYYSVTNSMGYTTMKMRNITVINSEETNVIASLSDDNMTNENIDIELKITGENYSYTILPDNSKTEKTNIIYEVLENGKYEFTIVNKDDTNISKIVVVDNIDKTLPEGSCQATLYNDKTMVTVNITSFNYIVGYNYLVDNNESGYLSTNTYTKSVESNGNVSVKVKDYIGNEQMINCTSLDKKYKYDPNGYRTIISNKPRLHIAIADALAKKGYTVSDLNMCIYKRVLEAGPGTRYGVAAAAYGLIDCTYSMTGYVLAYNHESGKVEGDNYCRVNKDICGKLGINTRWGKTGGQCASSADGVCWHGLNCATFVRWAMCNGGMDLCTRGSASAFGMVSKQYFPEADGVYVKAGRVRYYSGRNLTGYTADQLVRMLKPGDIIASSEGGGHAFVAVGMDNDGIYTAEDGYYMRKISYSTIVNGGENYLLFLLDNYYANAKNKNNLYS